MFKFITPAAWGIAVFGNVSGINGWSEWFSKPMYDYSPLVSLLALAAIALVCMLLTIARLKHVYRQKD